MGDVLRPQGDPEHGRLFTFRDVRLLMHNAARLTVEQIDRAFTTLGEDRGGLPRTGAEAIATIEELLADVTAEGQLTFPVDEPLFLLRASQRLAPAALSALVATFPEDWEEMHQIAEAYMAMTAWQEQHPDRVQPPPKETP